MDVDELLTTVALCSTCERSKRPDIMAVYEHLLSLERLDLSSNESYTFQMFAYRYQDWQERVTSMLSTTFGANGTRQLRTMARNLHQLPQTKVDEFGECPHVSLPRF